MSPSTINLILTLTSGPRAGDEFKVKDGVVIGRSTGDIQLRDPKTSNPHAQIRWDEANAQFILLDLGSTNKIRFEGKKLDQITLSKDCAFSLGRTQFKVQEGVESSIKSNISDWRQSLLKILTSTKATQPTVDKEIKAFTKPLFLKAQSGESSESQITLGYGPRFLGPRSFDLYLNITDSAAPPICFELHPHTSGVEFKTSAPELVQLNNQSVSSDILKDGDVISLFGYSFEVGFGS